MRWKHDKSFIGFQINHFKFCQYTKKWFVLKDQSSFKNFRFKQLDYLIQTRLTQGTKLLRLL